MITSGNVIEGSTSVITDPTTTCDIPTNGLVLSYPLTGTAEDKTGSYNGTETSMEYVYDDSMGIVSNFNGTSSYIMTPTINGPLDSWSISFWVKPLNADLLHFFVAPDQGTFACKYYKTSGYVYIYNSSNGSFTSGDNSVPAGIFSHISMTSNPSGSEIYVNGVLIKTSTKNYVIPKAIFSIGKYDAERSNMNLSNLHLYNRVLSAQEIVNIYNLESRRHNIPVDKGLVAYYPLDSNSLDNSTGQYDGTDTSINYVYDSLLDSTVAEFNNINSHVVIDGFSQKSGKEPITVAGWVKLNSNGSQCTLFCGNRDDSTGRYAFYAKESKIVIGIYQGNTLTFNTTLSLNQWYHLCITSNSNGRKIYLDSNLVASDVVQYLNDATDDILNIYIGNNPYSIANNLDDGYKNVKQVRVYNRALSQQEITQIYDCEKPNSNLCKLSITTNDYDPFKDGSGIALWRFDNNLLDASGNHNLTGSPLYNTTGVFNSCLNLDGTARNIQGGFIPEFKLQEYTMSCWVKLNNTPSSSQTIMSNHGESHSSGDQNNAGSIIYIGNDRTVRSTYSVINAENYTDSNGNGNSGYAITSFSSISLQVGEWYHLCGVYYGSSSNLFINGVLDCSVSSNQVTKWNGTSSYFSIGSLELNYADLHYNISDCSIDQARFFNRVLTEAEVLSLYKEEQVHIV